MATYKTPGVYVEEVSTLPPSVAEVSTAVPAFIGCTANGPVVANNKVTPVVKRINTLLEYETAFGEAKPRTFSVSTVASSTNPTEIEIGTVTNNADPVYEFSLYHSLSLYFKNGGGSCYIISIGNYDAKPTKAQFEAGLAALEKEDEPTLILLTEAIGLGATEYYDLCQQALAQCKKLGDRFAILDVPTASVDAFRTAIGTTNLMYGAAYYPSVQTTLTYDYNEVDVKLTGLTPSSATFQKAFGTKGILVNYSGASTDAPKARIVAGTTADTTFGVSGKTLTITVATGGKTGNDIVAAWGTWKAANTAAAGGFDIAKNDDGSGTIDATDSTALTKTSSDAGTSLDAIKSTRTALYNQVKTVLSQQRVTLPAGPAVAGIYASVDRDRGVWKAPANVSLSSVIGPTVKISHEDQENLNVDTTAGKSINAIRAFTGKGTLVWGARTLAGNDNEWRYVSVRRLFNMIEESTQKATSFAVFEPNDATTWLKVKAMIESYLYGLWQQGALAGQTPDDAYFVNVGLGKTMTPQDVLEGRMIVEIGVAAVRPAEFIILRFTHKLQQA